jgi:hypothetical protein
MLAFAFALLLEISGIKPAEKRKQERLTVSNFPKEEPGKCYSC